MFRLKIVPANTKIPFIGQRRFFFVFSALLVLAAIALVLIRGLNFGIDFRGGILIELKTPGPADIADMRGRISVLGLGDVALQEFGASNDVLVRLPMQDGGEPAQQAAVDKVKAAMGPGVDYRRVEVVGPQVSDELFWDGVAAVALAMLGILVYIWFRFEWQFGVAALIALMHDVISTIGVFALLGMEFNLTTVAAMLTIAGYSINDTVVVFDRIRENLRKYKAMPLPALLDVSINETLSRTVMTSFTTLLAVGALFVFGGEVIRGFSFAMIWGIGIGTYSSIGVASALLLYMRPPRAGKAEEAAAA